MASSANCFATFKETFFRPIVWRVWKVLVQHGWLSGSYYLALMVMIDLALLCYVWHNSTIFLYVGINPNYPFCEVGISSTNFFWIVWLNPTRIGVVVHNSTEKDDDCFSSTHQILTFCEVGISSTNLFWIVWLNPTRIGVVVHNSTEKDDDCFSSTHQIITFCEVGISSTSEAISSVFCLMW